VRKSFLAVGIAIAAILAGAGWTRNKLAPTVRRGWGASHAAISSPASTLTGTLAAVDSGSFGPPQINDVWDFKISMVAPEGSDVKQGQPVLGLTRWNCKSASMKRAPRAAGAQRDREGCADLALRREDEKLKLADAEGRLRKAQLKLEGPPDIVSTKDRNRSSSISTGKAGDRIDPAAHRLIREGRVGADRAADEQADDRRAIVTGTKNAISAMTIMAPRNGTIVYVTNWRGDKKKVGDTCWRMERVIEIPDLARIDGQGRSR